MKLTNLKLTNFRNYEDLEINFCDNYNIIYGKNGTGKTNLVESIYLLALTKSFRCNKDDLLIKKNADTLIVEGVIKTKILSKYNIKISNNLKEVSIDNLKQNKLSNYISNVNVILFNPEDLFLIKEAPLERRKLLNIEISKVYREYLFLLSKYNKVLKMRNAYLKMAKETKKYSLEYLDILTINLIENGQKLCNYRKEFIEDINKYIVTFYKINFGYGILSLKYISFYKNKDFENILEIYQSNYNKEINYGKTLFGIHHDDMIFYLDGNKLKDWGSIGQQKNSILSFKFAQIALLKELKKESPILILDDLFSELDNEKITNILKNIDKDLQIFITTTDIEKFNLGLFESYKVFKIENEQVLEEENE